MVWMLLFGGCTSCLPPDDVGDEGLADSAPPADSGDFGEDSGEADSGEDDTGPVVIERCTLEEVEDENPANDFSQVLSVPLGTVACGDVNTEGDRDFLTFTTTTPGWMKVAVEAASRGSSADMVYALNHIQADEAVVQAGQNNSTDPLNVFWADTPGDYLVSLGESFYSFGEAYPWWFVAMPTKAPYEYHLVDGAVVNDSTIDELALVPVDEDEGTNDDIERAQVLELNQPVFGRIGDPSDYDWFVVRIPEGTTHLVQDVDAVEFGSAADIQLTLYWGGTQQFWMMEDGNDGRDSAVAESDPWEKIDLAHEREKTEAIVAGADTGVYPGTIEYDTVYIRVRNWVLDDGSMFHWYTLRVHAMTEEK